MKLSMKELFSKCDQIRWKLQICSHLLRKFFMENFFFVQCIWIVCKKATVLTLL